MQAGREQGKSQVPANGLSHQACEDINSSRPGACASFSQRRNHAASFSLCSAPEESFPLGLKEIPRASFILAWECPMVACALLLSHWLSIATGKCLCPSASQKVSWGGWKNYLKVLVGSCV